MLPRYDHPKISEIWSIGNKYLVWTQIELSFLSELKAVSILAPDHFESSWIDDIQSREMQTKHDVVAFVEWLESKVHETDPLFSRFVHYGLTSSDIVDTAFSMMIRASNEVITDLLRALVSILKQKISECDGIMIVGRTHGQAAELMPLSQKFDTYLHTILRYGTFKCAYYGRLADSVGSLKYVNRAVVINTLSKLNLVEGLYDGQIIHRGIYAERMNEWALLASAIAKIATDIRLLSQSGIEEMAEGFEENQVGSSSMPHKRNPIQCENICGLARVIRGYQTTVMQNIELWNELDISHSSAERIVFPDAAVLLGFMIERMTNIITNLRIDKDKIARNTQTPGLSVINHM